MYSLDIFSIFVDLKMIQKLYSLVGRTRWWLPSPIGSVPLATIDEVIKMEGKHLNPNE
jgi:hypothetical protein